jgi:hypothetical protein
VESHHATSDPIVGSVTAAIQEISIVDNIVSITPSRASFSANDFDFQRKSGDPSPEESQPVAQTYFNVANNTITVVHGNQHNIQNFIGALVYKIHRPFVYLICFSHQVY